MRSRVRLANFATTLAWFPSYRARLARTVARLGSVPNLDCVRLVTIAPVRRHPHNKMHVFLRTIVRLDRTRTRWCVCLARIVLHRQLKSLARRAHTVRREALPTRCAVLVRIVRIRPPPTIVRWAIIARRA